MLKFPFVHDPCTLGFFCFRSLDLVFFINFLFIDQKKKKEDKGKLGSSLSRSRLGNYPNSHFVYVWVRENPNSHYKGILVGSS